MAMDGSSFNSAEKHGAQNLEEKGDEQSGGKPSEVEGIICKDDTF